MKRANNDRKFPDGFGKRPDLSELKKTEGKERQEYYNGLTIEQKIEKLDAKFGKGVGAKKQRAQFTNTPIAKESDTIQALDIVSVEEETPTKLKAKERKKNEQK